MLLRLRTGSLANRPVSSTTSRRKKWADQNSTAINLLARAGFWKIPRNPPGGPSTSVVPGIPTLRQPVALRDDLSQGERVIHEPKSGPKTFRHCGIGTIVREPVVRYLGAEYVGPQLARMRSESGLECILIVHNNSAHCGRLYAADGTTEIDVVHARGEWRLPHRLRDREIFRKRMRRRPSEDGDSQRNLLLRLKAHFEKAKELSKDAMF